MSQEPRIVQLPPKTLVGMSREMSRIDDKTAELWRAFMPRRSEIRNRADENFISMQVFPAGPAQLADPTARFVKWAVVEVEGASSEVPGGMASYTLAGGMYGVFEHRGPATDLRTFMYIFRDWLPSSLMYEIDDREHFEVLPPNYDARDPNAREDIWIPIRMKAAE